VPSNITSYNSNDSGFVLFRVLQILTDNVLSRNAFTSGTAVPCRYTLSMQQHDRFQAQVTNTAAQYRANTYLIK
jgi:hypothetical protein